MRIEQDILKIGDFWLPSNPSERLRGILNISEGGEIGLDVVGRFSSVKNSFEDVEIPRINGIIEDYGYVTLENCHYKHLTIFSTNPKRSTIKVQMAVLGAAFDKDEALEFNTVGFTVEGANEWRFKSGIEINHDFDKKTATIYYEPQKNVEIPLEDDVVLTMFSRWNIPGAPSIGEAKISEDTYFEITSTRLQDINMLIDKASKIARFLCFASDTTVSLKNVWVKRHDLYNSYNKETHLHSINLIYPSRPYKNSRDKITWDNFIFLYPDIADKVTEVFQNWLKSFEIIGPTVNLYFAATEKDTGLLEAKFLFLVQAVETYHRRKYDTKRVSEEDFLEFKNEIIEKCPEEHRGWIERSLKYSNEVSLRTRIKEVLEPFKDKFGNSEVRKKMINMIVNTRNYLTHFDNSLEPEAASGHELFRLCVRLELLLQLIILREIGFGQDEVNIILQNHRKLGQKLKF